jgi:uncharacterized protein (DUF2141 family)
MTLPRRIRATAAAMPAAGAAVALAAIPLPAQAEGAPAGCTGSPSDTWVNVVVEGVKSSDGLIAVTLYPDNSRRFLIKNGSLQVGRVKAVAGTTRACITVPRPGVYVLAVYHDEDGDQNFDRTGLGLPAEGYGFSNNPSTLAGLPSFRSVRIAIPRTNLTARIKLKYP